MPIVIVVRHGESEMNAANRAGRRSFCGQFDTPLTDRGRQQARDVGAQLARAGVRPEWAVSSCLARAVDTLQLLTDSLPSRPQLLPAMPDFNERSLGDFEGRSEADVYRDHPQYRDHPDFSEFRNHFEQRAPGGENLADVTRRVWAAWRDVRRRASGDVLIVSHGSALQAWLGRALGLAPAEVLSIAIPNTQPLILEFTGSTDDALPAPGYRLLSTSFSRSATRLE